MISKAEVRRALKRMESGKEDSPEVSRRGGSRVFDKNRTGSYKVREFLRNREVCWSLKTRETIDEPHSVVMEKRTGI